MKKVFIIYMFIILLFSIKTFSASLFQLVPASKPDDVTNAIFLGEDVNALNEYFRTPLLQYVSYNTPNPEVVKALINAGADVNFPGADGKTPLMIAAGRNFKAEVIRILVKEGADVNAKDINGSTALIFASYNIIGNLQFAEIIKTLIEAGAEVNYPKNGMSPLIISSGSNTPEVVQALIDAGAEINSKNQNSMTALMYAAQITHFPEIITLLLNAGANPRLKDNREKSAFDYAVNNQYLKGSQELEALR